MRRFVLVSAFALATASCGGGGSGSSTDAAPAVVLPPPPSPPPTTPAPTPPPAGSVGTDAGLAAQSVTAIASNFDPMSELLAASLPPSAAPDVVGAFRFICMPGQLKADDPIVYPGQPGRSHLHQFFGNDTADAYSTYASLRASGNSTCMSPVNRSAYWVPALLNGKGQVVRPDYVTIYYKRRPKSDPIVSDPTHPQYQGKAVNLPNGLRFIFGRDMLNLGDAPTGALHFACDGPVPYTPQDWSNFEDAQRGCPVGNRIGARMSAPDCWDGKNLDSADHRSHVSYGAYGDWGYLRCPTTHPFVIPTFTIGVWYTQAAGETYSFVSDHMDTSPTHKRGDTFHSDFFMAWDPIVHEIWEKNCLDKMLNCSAGDLGNGQQIKQSWEASWTANPRLVSLPNS